MVDLHTHSNFSDGELSPEMLINKAVKQGLRAIALTDHDTIKGLDCAQKAAASYNLTLKPENEHHAENIKGFSLIPGIEISINWSGGKTLNGTAPGLGPGGEFHLLGLGIKSPSRSFITAVDGLARRREVRNLEILEKMIELSIIKPEEREQIWNELAIISNGNSLGRPHFAAFLIKRKIVRNINHAFNRFLGVGKPLYVPKDGLVFEEAVTLIKESGGIPVLAHPISLYVAWGRLPDLIKALKDMGLMGLEAWHPTAKAGSCRRLESLAQTLNLYVTEGSDFHGSLRPDRRLGYSGKSRKISDAVLEAIPQLH
ncbi:MAG: PHP domain-containing protein [Treponema sp.]|jgi:predicted metal-dependent phosphoesterase TrpH|nr:PHP domain-containing protein [Treponema sp.]